MSLDFLFLPEPFEVVVTGATSLHVSNSTAANCDENAAMSKLDRFDTESVREDISDNDSRGRLPPSPQKRLANIGGDSLRRTLSSFSFSGDPPPICCDSDTTLESVQQSHLDGDLRVGLFFQEQI